MSGTVVCSFVLKVNLDDFHEVSHQLNRLDGLEIHGHENGKIVITLDAESENDLIKSYRAMKQIKGLLAVDLVFAGFEGEDDKVEFTALPDWLNTEIDARKINYSGKINLSE